MSEMFCRQCTMPFTHGFHVRSEDCEDMMAENGAECAAPEEHHMFEPMEGVTFGWVDKDGKLKRE